MRQMQIGKVDPSLKIEHELINKLPKIELLYLAGIFHDLGKGKGGDHSEIGEKIVEKFCKRLNFSLHEEKNLTFYKISQLSFLLFQNDPHLYLYQDHEKFLRDTKAQF